MTVCVGLASLYMGIGDLPFSTLKNKDVSSVESIFNEVEVGETIILFLVWWYAR